MSFKRQLVPAKHAASARARAAPHSRPVGLRANTLLGTTSRFRSLVWRFYKKQGRHDLPWRKTHDPYKILVSEVMLQQTQVERVLPFYKKFIKKFPTAKKLAAASLSDVLLLWQGLGYNRRAKMLHTAARELSRLNLAKTRSNLVEELEKLPGVGPYTARAVAAFAYNQDVIFVETNIRTAIIHHFYSRGVRAAGTSSPQGARAARPIQPFVNNVPAARVSDTEILAVLERVLPKGKARDWYSALMDYGAYLKKSGVKLNTKSTHYTKQSKFVGSKREARGLILRELSVGDQLESHLLRLLGAGRSLQLRGALVALEIEGLVQKHGRYFGLPHQ